MQHCFMGDSLLQGAECFLEGGSFSSGQEIKVLTEWTSSIHDVFKPWKLIWDVTHRLQILKDEGAVAVGPLFHKSRPCLTCEHEGQWHCARKEQSQETVLAYWVQQCINYIQTSASCAIIHLIIFKKLSRNHNSSSCLKVCPFKFIWLYIIA